MEVVFSGDLQAYRIFDGVIWPNYGSVLVHRVDLG
jgi:hypothetical protein